MRHTHRERERHRHRQREKQAPRRDPDTGLDPRTPGSCPEPKADIQPLSHPGVLTNWCPCARTHLFPEVRSIDVEPLGPPGVGTSLVL